MKSINIACLISVAALFAHAAGADEVTMLPVASVQMRSSGDLAANVASLQRSLHECAKRGVRAAVFPECALTGYLPDVIAELLPEDVLRAEQQVAETCRELRIYAVVGTPHFQGDSLYNSATVFTPQGKVLERYHKVQLAERWPVEGDHLSVFPIDGVPCSIIICHDERYPELVRLPVLAGAKVIFYLSHESGVKQEHKIDPYRAQIQARAVENGVFVVHANAPANEDLSGSHGHSRIIGPDGNLIGREASIFDEEILSATLELERASRSNALRSVRRGPFGDWWRDGIKRVRLIRKEDAVAVGAVTTNDASRRLVARRALDADQQKPSPGQAPTPPPTQED